MDIYNHEKRIESYLNKLKNSNISKKNQKLIVRFYEFCFSNSLSSARIARYLQDILKVVVWLNMDLVRCRKEPTNYPDKFHSYWQINNEHDFIKKILEESPVQRNSIKIE
ncbi:MAG: hypothetical protein JSW08_00680 [archaeon]|nr:MAG: hypothetical protein JSW08_00680 [archaeon]